jgi:hypothetical protein
MQPAHLLSCPVCGTPVSAFGGRCPSCGAELPAEPPRPARAPRPQRRAAPRSSPLRPLALAAGITLALGALVGGAWYLSNKSAELADPAGSAETATAAPPAAALPFDPLDLHNALTTARRRAQSWQADAALASIQVSAVDKGRVAESGTIEVEFGRPKNGQLGPRAPLLPERLFVKIGGQAPETAERRGKAAESIADPNCPLEQAWRKMVASGIPSNATVSMRYELSKRHDRAVWVATAAEADGAVRILDGNNCAILPR